MVKVQHFWDKFDNVDVTKAKTKSNNNTFFYKLQKFNEPQVYQNLTNFRLKFYHFLFMLNMTSAQTKLRFKEVERVLIWRQAKKERANTSGINLKETTNVTIGQSTDTLHSSVFR